MDKTTIDYLFSAAYEQLKQAAKKIWDRDPSFTYSPTAMVNEAYLSLIKSLKLSPESDLHFRRIVAKAMRNVLVEASRRKTAQKRGGKNMAITFDEAMFLMPTSSEQVLALDQALEKFEKFYPRPAEQVVLRFFAGYDVRDISEMMGISTSTLDRDWVMAKAWLSKEMNKSLATTA